MRSRVEGTCGGRGSGAVRAPSTTIRAVPLPRFAGQDEARTPQNGRTCRRGATKLSTGTAGPWVIARWGLSICRES
jgi:hypothetical protein